MRDLPEMDLRDRKIDLTLRLMVDPADQDYVAARWAYHNGIFNVFYWSAAQACEKYLKAALLLNDISVESYGHNIIDLYSAVAELDINSILPKSIDLPETSAMGREAWQGKPVRSYIDYLASYGSADNRYGVAGTFVNGPVLHVLDTICCALRKLIRKENFLEGDLFLHINDDLPLYERIPQSEEWMADPRLLLERLFVNRYQVGQGKDLRFMFSNMNFAFFKMRTENEKSFGGQHFHGSPLHNHLVRLGEIEQSTNNKKIIEELREWAEQKIYMSNSVRAALKLPKKGRGKRDGT